MDKTEAEQKFEEYREHLRQEAVRLASYIALYRRLHELRTERLDERNSNAAKIIQTGIGC